MTGRAYLAAVSGPMQRLLQKLIPLMIKLKSQAAVRLLDKISVGQGEPRVAAQVERQMQK